MLTEFLKMIMGIDSIRVHRFKRPSVDVKELVMIIICRGWR